jgi:hypothetical protein
VVRHVADLGLKMAEIEIVHESALKERADPRVQFRTGLHSLVLRQEDGIGGEQGDIFVGVSRFDGRGLFRRNTEDVPVARFVL